MGGGVIGDTKARMAAGLLVRHGRALLCLRAASRRSFPSVWDLPGGHVEPGEAPAAALRRELAEELGIDVAEPSREPLARLIAPDLGIDLAIWTVSRWKGEPRNTCPEEHDAIGWFTPVAAAELPLAHQPTST